MLIRFEVENFRSIAEPVELSMVAVDKDRDSVVPVTLLGESLLKVAAIYGPNASGKSNVVAALAWLLDAFPSSVNFWNDEIPCEPFAFGARPAKPSRFTIEVTVDGVRFEYQVELNADRILWEALYHYPNKLRRKIFERDGQQLSFQRGIEGYSGTKELLSLRSLVITIAPRFGDPLVTSFYDQIRSMSTYGIRHPAWSTSGGWRFVSPPRRTDTMAWFDDNPRQQSLLADDDDTPVDRDKALSLLRYADPGITDVLIDTEQIRLADSSTHGTRRRTRLLHQIGVAVSPLAFDDESEGTKNWFWLIGPVLETIANGSLLVVDELNASLHPTLSATLIDLFERADTNPNGAQVLFTSHDTSLLNHLNRDEVWLTEKSDDGMTHIGALAEFAGQRVRKSVKLEAGYLSGRFGALPQIDQAGFLRALGLIG